MNDDSDLPALVERYRQILVAEASDAALDEGLDLLEAIVRFPMPDDGGGRHEHDLDAEDEEDRAVQRALSEEVRRFAEYRFESDRVAREANRRQVRIWRRYARAFHALMLSGALTHQVASVSDARSSLLLDVTLVLAHQAYFCLVLDPPRTFVRAATQVRDAMWAFAATLPRSADAELLRAQVADHRGDVQAASYYHGQALQLIEPGAHEYMTVLQTAWSYCIEHDARRAAMDLLLSEAPRLRTEDRPEFDELVRITVHGFERATRRRAG